MDMLKAGENPLCSLLCSKHCMAEPAVSVVCSDAIAVPEPFLDSFVFLRVKETQENILVEPETDDQR